MIPCSHVAASAARARRDHCLLWTRLATPAAGRRLQVHLQNADVGGESSNLDSLTQLDELHKTVQQRVDDVPKWSVQMYPTTRLAAQRYFPPIKGPPRAGPRHGHAPSTGGSRLALGVAPLLWLVVHARNGGIEDGRNRRKRNSPRFITFSFACIFPAAVGLQH